MRTTKGDTYVVRNGYLLRLGFKKLDASDMKQILERLSEEPAPRPEKCCRHEGVQKILASLPQPRPLRGINFGGNVFIADEGMEHLHLIPPTVIDLDLSRCGLTEVGIKTLCPFMKTNTSITRLLLWGNLFGDDGARHIRAILEGDTTLQQNESNENGIIVKGITTKEWSSIGKALKQNRTLRKLSLGDRLFQNRDILTLGSGLKQNVGWTELDSKNTALSDLAMRRHLPLI
jgi:hypothetical protein